MKLEVVPWRKEIFVQSQFQMTCSLSNEQEPHYSSDFLYINLSLSMILGLMSYKIRFYQY